MQSQPFGGYILVGVDGIGEPTTAHGPINANQFDPATLNGIAHSYLPSIRVNATTHEVDGITVAMIFVGAPDPPAIAIFSKDGQYADATGRSQTVFRAGDVFVRRGTQSVRWSYTDLAWVLTPIENAVREDERRRATAYVDAVSQGQRGRSLATGPIGSLSWQLEDNDFQSALLEAMRANDEIPIRHAFLSLVGEAGALLNQSDGDDDLNRLLDRLTTALSLAVTYDDRKLFAAVLATFQSIYALGVTGDGNLALGVRGIRLLWGIATRIEAVGGLAIRLRGWWAIRPLTLHGDGRLTQLHYVSWFRHALTEASRANLLYTEPDENGNPVEIGGPLVAVARQHVERIPALRPDTPSVSRFELNTAPDEHDPVLDSLAQFDAIWGIVAVARSRREFDHYPSFAAFYARRTAPVLETLAASPDVRQQVAHEDEPFLRDAMKSVIDTAEQQSWAAYHRPWDLHSSVVQTYLEDQPERPSL
jgi:hypothetical protein